MDLVMSRFANSVDTVKGGDIRKTVLLASSEHSRVLPRARAVTLESVQQQPNPRDYRLRNVPVAVLLEGRFPSLFNHRLGAAEQKALETASGKPFQSNGRHYRENDRGGGCRYYH